MEIGYNSIRMWTGFVVSLIASALSSLAMAFNVYALQLKRTFDFTQTQVELVASVGSIGFALACVEFVIYRKFGYKACYVTVLMTSPMACCLFYAATSFSDVFKGQAIVIGVFQLLSNFGNNILQALLSQISVQNFDDSHMGIVLGLYTGVTGSGKIVHAAIFELFFINNFKGFWVTLGPLWLLIYGLCFVLHRPIGKATQSKTEEEYNCSETERRLIPKTSQIEYSIKDMACSVFFQLTFWPMVVIGACFSAFMNNLTSIAESAGFTDPIQPVYLFSVTQVLSHVLFGLFFDKLRSDFRGFYLLFASYAMFSLGILVGLLYFNRTGVFVMAFLIAFSSPGRNSLPISMLCYKFGHQHYGVIYCADLIAYSSVVLVIQTAVGFLYDVALDENNSVTHARFCIGSSCFRWTLVILLAVISVLVICVQVLNFVLYRRKIFSRRKVLISEQ